MYAVVELQGHQYIVSKDAEIVVDKIADEKAKKLDISNVHFIKSNLLNYDEFIGTFDLIHCQGVLNQNKINS